MDSPKTVDNPHVSLVNALIGSNLVFLELYLEVSSYHKA